MCLAAIVTAAAATIRASVGIDTLGYSTTMFAFIRIFAIATVRSEAVGAGPVGAECGIGEIPGAVRAELHAVAPERSGCGVRGGHL